jgi:hypothetical protein
VYTELVVSTPLSTQISWLQATSPALSREGEGGYLQRKLVCFLLSTPSVFPVLFTILKLYIIKLRTGGRKRKCGSKSNLNKIKHYRCERKADCPQEGTVHCGWKKKSGKITNLIKGTYRNKSYKFFKA